MAEASPERSGISKAPVALAGNPLIQVSGILAKAKLEVLIGNGARGAAAG